MPSFTAAICPQNTGLTEAENMVQETLDLIADQAQEVLDLALDTEAELSGLGFPSLGVSFVFNGTGQLDQFEIPTKPTIDTNDLEFEYPDDPRIEDLSNIFSINPDKNFPIFSTSVITNLAALLVEMMANVETLPEEWVESNWARARDRITRDETARLAEVEGEYARRGWASEVGVESARKDLFRDRASTELSEANRSFAIKVYEEALVSLRLAAQLAVEYLKAWVSAYAAYIDAVSEDQKNRIRKNEFVVQQLEQQVKVFDSKIRGESSRIESLVRAYGLEWEGYRGDISLQEAVSKHDQAKFAQETERRRIEADVRIQDNEARLSARSRDIQERSQNLRTRGDILRQLGAALWQALNVGASTSVGYSRGNSTNCSTNYSYSESG